MTDEIKQLIVTVPTEEWRQVLYAIQDAQEEGRINSAVTVRDAPQLWVLAVETEDLPRPSVTIHATEASAVMHLRDYDENVPAYVPDEEVADWLATHSNIWATIERMEYPVASSYVR